MLSRTIGWGGQERSLSIVLLILILLELTLLIPARCAPVEEWNRTFGGPDFDYPICLQQTLEGGYMLTGSSNSNPIDFPALSSGWAIKTESKGNKEWNISFQKLEDESGITNILPTRDGGFILTGSAPHETRFVNIRENPAGEEINVTSSLAFLKKTDGYGKEQWRKMFGTFGIYDISSIAQSNDGGFIMAGMAMPFGYLGAGNAWIIKTDSRGNEQWNRSFEGNMYGATSIRQTSDGGYVVTGPPAVVIKINEKGKIEWNKTYKGKEFDYVR